MMEAAEGGRAVYRRIADRAAALYSPVVHTIALASFFAWLMATGDWHTSVTIAIAVLIVTCPCALGLAVPIVQVVAARRLFELGIMVKDGSGLERLAEIDVVAFDKTGTLTLGTQSLVNARQIDPEAGQIAQAMAVHSRHPGAKAIAAADFGVRLSTDRFLSVSEYPGLGLEARSPQGTFRLGRPEWALGSPEEARLVDGATVSVLTTNGGQPVIFSFADGVRPDASAALNDLVKRELAVIILSGDRTSAVESLAPELGVRDWAAGLLPGDKVQRIADLSVAGRKVLMVGDGLNDAPALSAAHVSMAPANAADIGRNAADFVFLGQNLSAVTEAYDIARRAERLIRQNFALAIGYNVLAVPVAAMGYLTPLVAAVAMSLSSVTVVLNAMRLSLPDGALSGRAIKRRAA